jgi:hypothetical protein
MSLMYSKPSRPTWPQMTTSAPRASSSSASVPPSRGGSRLRSRAASAPTSGWRSAMTACALASFSAVWRVPSG